MFLHTYKTLIRPIVEYGNVIWCPHLKKDIVAIKKIQRKANKIVPTLRYLQYKEILQRLYLTTLEVRRWHSDLLQSNSILMALMRLIISYFVAKFRLTLIFYKRTYFQNSQTTLLSQS